MQRPDPSEHPPVYWTYIDRVPSRPVLDILEEAPPALAGLLGDLTPEQESWAYADGKWSIRESLCHIVDIERLASYRAMHIARSGRVSLPGMDREAWIAASGAALRPVADLLSEFRHLRMSNCRLFASFDDPALDRRGVANGAEVTPRAIIFFAAGHELHHRQILEERYLAPLKAAG